MIRRRLVSVHNHVVLLINWWSSWAGALQWSKTQCLINIISVCNCRLFTFVFYIFQLCWVAVSMRTSSSEPRCLSDTKSSSRMKWTGAQLLPWLCSHVWIKMRQACGKEIQNMKSLYYARDPEEKRCYRELEWRKKRVSAGGQNNVPHSIHEEIWHLQPILTTAPSPPDNKSAVYQWFLHAHMQVHIRSCAHFRMCTSVLVSNYLYLSACT